MNTIMIGAERDVLVVVEHGQQLGKDRSSRAAPTMLPRIEPSPPSTAITTNSIERRKPAVPGVTKPVEQREIGAGDRGIDRRQHESDQLVARDIDAEHAGGDFAVMDGAQARARSANRSG